jgi:chromosome segregation protein
LIAVLDALLGSVLVVDSLEHAVAYYRTASEDGSLPPAASLVTLDGVVIDGHGTMVGGAQKGQGASMLAVRRELRELTQQVAELEERFQTQEEQLVVGRKELTHLQESLAELQKAGHQGEMQLLSLDKDLLKAREEMHRTSHRLESIDRERDELSTRRDEMVRESEELRLSLRTARDLLEQLEEQLERRVAARSGCLMPSTSSGKS